MSTLERLLAQPPERLLLVALGVWLLFAIESWRCHAVVRRWCEAHGFRLVRMRRSWAVFGPFPLRSKHQVVWRITADDLKLGERRQGHARCGGFFSGLWSDDVAVEWQFTPEELSDGRERAAPARPSAR